MSILILLFYKPINIANIKNASDKTNSNNWNKIVFLNQEILTKKEEILFEQYDLEVFEENLSEILPIKYKTVVYHEVETKTVETNFEEVKEEKIALAKQLALSMLAEGETIKAENSLITEENGRFVVSHSITVSRKIS